MNIVFCCGCSNSGDNMFLVMGGIKLTTAVVIVNVVKAVVVAALVVTICF